METDIVTMNFIAPNLTAQHLNIGIVQSRFSNDICSKMSEICIHQLQTLGVAKTNITLLTVPGALEIPVMLQNLALSNQFHALIAIGSIIRGETYHFEVVSNESAAGVSRVALDFNLPIINAILTTENEQQAYERIEIKSKEAAEAAIECANLSLHFNALIDETQS